MWKSTGLTLKPTCEHTRTSTAARWISWSASWHPDRPGCRSKWNDYERIQAEIFDHLLAALQFFDLRVFQEPSGSDFTRALQIT